MNWSYTGIADTGDTAYKLEESYETEKLNPGNISPFYEELHSQATGLIFAIIKLFRDDENCSAI